MPVVTIQVPAGALDADKKSTMIAKVTDAVDGGWGIGGRAITLEKMKAALAAKS